MKWSKIYRGFYSVNYFLIFVKFRWKVWLLDFLNYYVLWVYIIVYIFIKLVLLNIDIKGYNLN